MTRALLCVAALALAGCGGAQEEAGLVVFAASSLAEVAPAVDARATVVTGGSNDLAAQIRDGAEAGVLLSASAAPVEELRSEGLVGPPVAFASNRLVLVASTRAERVRGLADLAGEGVTLVVGADGVPVGDYARELLSAAGLEGRVEIVSLEEDVKGVLGKVSLGEADAGIVYATDARAAGDDVRTIALPERLQPDIRYYAALVEPATAAARAYVERLRGAEGQRALRAAGFLPLR